ncbi:hypothetical protein D3C80_177790 [compost metagenome]
MQGKTKQHGEQQHLQDVAAGKGTNHAAGNDVQQEGDDALIFGLLGVNGDGFRIERRRIDVHPRPRLYHVHNNQPDNQRDGADHFKVQQRNCTGPTHRLHTFHASDTGHHGTENNGRDDHFDELNEGIAKRFHLSAQFRVEMAKQNTDGNRCQDLKVKAFKDGGFHRVSLGRKTTGFLWVMLSCGSKITPVKHDRNELRSNLKHEC